MNSGPKFDAKQSVSVDGDGAMTAAQLINVDNDDEGENYNVLSSMGLFSKRSQRHSSGSDDFGSSDFLKPAREKRAEAASPSAHLKSVPRA